MEPAIDLIMPRAAAGLSARVLVEDQRAVGRAASQVEASTAASDKAAAYARSGDLARPASWSATAPSGMTPASVVAPRAGGSGLRVARRRAGIALVLIVLALLTIPSARATAATSTPAVGITAAQTGYALVAADGGVFTFGGALFHGSMADQPHVGTIVGMASAPGGGYWLVASDGGVFSFGGAQFHGSMGGQALNAPVVGMAATPSGAGYWLVAADGGVFSFGDAGFHGSLGSIRLNAPVSGIAATPSGQGYWLSGTDGGVFAFGDAPYRGNACCLVPPAVGNQPPPGATRARIVAIAQPEVGYREGARNYNKYSKTVDQEWCAYFASWVWSQAGVQISLQSYVGSIATWSLRRGQWKPGARNNPQPGDAIIFGGSQPSGDYFPLTRHVGIVESVLPDGRIVTIEGNNADAVRRNGPFDPGSRRLPVLGYASPVPLAAAKLQRAFELVDPVSTPLPTPTAEDLAGQDGEGSDVVGPTPPPISVAPPPPPTTRPTPTLTPTPVPGRTSPGAPPPGVAPTLGRLGVTFRRGLGFLRLSTSARGTLTLRLQRRSAGLRRGGRCVVRRPGQRGRRCVRLVAVGRVRRQGVVASRRIIVRLPARLVSGRYIVTVSLTSTEGRRSAPRSLRFRAS